MLGLYMLASILWAACAHDDIVFFFHDIWSSYNNNYYSLMLALYGQDCTSLGVKCAYIYTVNVCLFLQDFRGVLKTKTPKTS